MFLLLEIGYRDIGAKSRWGGIALVEAVAVQIPRRRGESICIAQEQAYRPNFRWVSGDYDNLATRHEAKKRVTFKAYEQISKSREQPLQSRVPTKWGIESN